MTNRLPACVSVPLNSLCEASASFVRNYLEHKQRIQSIGHTLQGIDHEYKRMESETTWKSRAGQALKGLGYIVGLPTAAGAGLSVSHGGGEKTLVAGGLALLTASAVVITTGDTTARNANLRKLLREQDMIKSVKELADEFMTIIGEQKNILEEIERLSDELEENSSFIRTAAGAQAKTTLSDIEEFQRLHNQINELTEDVKAAHVIAQSALQCEKIINELAKTEDKLKDFEENEYIILG